WRLATQLLVAVSGVLYAVRIGSDEAGSVARVQERRRLSDGWNSAIPIVSGGVVSRTVRIVGGIESELAQALARVVASPDPAHVPVHDPETGPQDCLVVKTVSRPKARPEVLVVSVDRIAAVASRGTRSGKLKRTQTTADCRIREIRIKERHEVVDFIEWTPQIP